MRWLKAALLLAALSLAVPAAAQESPIPLVGIDASSAPLAGTLNALIRQLNAQFTTGNGLLMTKSANNATLPDALNNLGVNSLFPNLLTGFVPVANTGNQTSVDLPTGVAADSTSATLIHNTGTCTVDLSTSGAGGLDTGTVAASTWYALYVMSGSSGTSCVGTLATPATNGTVTKPGGYTYIRYVGRVKTDASSHADTTRILATGKYWIDATDTYSPSATLAGMIVQGCGPGGPGGSGAVQITTTISSGGAGGGAGECTPPGGLFLAATDLGTSLTITVPTTAAGALAVTASAGTNGNTGSTASNLTMVNSASKTLLTLHSGGPGQGGLAAATNSVGGGSAGHVGDGGSGATGGTAGTGQGVAGGSGTGGASSTAPGIGAGGAGSGQGVAGSTAGSGWGIGAAGGASGGGTEGACTSTTHTGGNAGHAIGEYTQPQGGTSSSPNGASSTSGVTGAFLPAPGPGAGWGGPKATNNGGNGGDAGLGAGGAGGGSVCAGSGSMTSGAGGKGGPASVLLTEQ